MKKIIFICSIFVLLAARLHGAEAIWYPLHGNPNADGIHLSYIYQVGSEVYLIAIGPGAIFDPSVDLPAYPVSVDFPTLFIAGCWYSRMWPFGEPDVILFDGRPEPVGVYDAELGNGWIHHRKAAPPVHDGPLLLPSLGWIYIRSYPWVYGEDWGWRYVVESDIVWYANSWWFFEPDYGWFWTNRDTYPWIYHQSDGWVIYHPSSTAGE